MIEVLGAVGLLAFAVSSVSVGVRCVLRGARTGAVPELAVGFGFLVGVLFGYVPESVATSTQLFSDDTTGSVLMATQVSIRIAAVSVMVFTVSVFGRRGWIGPSIFASLLLALVASWIAFPGYASQAQSAGDRFWYEVFSISRAAAVAWGAAESLIYYRKSLRRLELGLSEPLVANRFLLWGVGLVALTVLMASTTLAKLVAVDPTSYSWLLLESLAGLVGATTLWLAFFPTRAYRERFERAADAVLPH